MNRIQKLCAYLDPCESFADVGCDHGYCTQYMLKNGLCKRAVISDISAKCLEKAEILLKNYIQSGAVKSVCCSGLEKIDESTDEVLIAGMGGDEIVEILKTAFVPNRFVLQPMKNARAVREFLLSRGAGITVDEPFEDCGKYYFVIKGTRTGNNVNYLQTNLNYGLNFKSSAARGYLKAELDKKKSYLERGLSPETRAAISQQADELKRILNDESN